MNGLRKFGRLVLVAVIPAALLLSGCDSFETLPPVVKVDDKEATKTEYRIGSDDRLSIFVWRNPELSNSVPVRPDGRITIPLIEDLPATGKTPTELARDIEKELGTYVQDPIVTVIVQSFVGQFQDRVRVVGEAARPQALPYRSTMTVLDVMISVGGLTDFAAGNRATITRMVDGKPKTFRVFLDDLIKEGDMSANVRILPGDILVIPEAWF